MRLISQNGEFDVPYEITPLSRTGNIIRIYIPISGEKGTIMAAYSTEKKAEKAMEMLRKVYTGMFLAQNVEMKSAAPSSLRGTCSCLPVMPEPPMRTPYPLPARTSSPTMKAACG